MKTAVLAGVMLAAGCTQRSATPPRGDWFTEIAAQAGIEFHHDAGRKGDFHMPEIMGAGCGLVDTDNDGDLDAVLVQSHGGPHELFRNEIIPTGSLRFTRLDGALGDVSGYGMGVSAGDFDGDGLTDLFISQFGDDLLLRNQGGNRFARVAAGVGDARWSTSSAFLDYDRDGRLDLFVLHYVDFTYRNHVRCSTPAGLPDYCTPRAYRPVAAALYRNEGRGGFRDVSVAAGITAALGPGLGVAVIDANHDLWPDLFVANDSMANLLWINNADGTFREEGLLSGTALNEDGIAKAGMGVASADYDSDGDEDLLVLNLKQEGASVFRRDRPGQFTDASSATGIRAATYPFTGFGTGWYDFDHDGRLDLFAANGGVVRAGPSLDSFRQRNQLLRGREGATFSDSSTQAGPAMLLEEVSRGAAFGDVDNDGDIDILVSNNNGPARLLRNERGVAGHWLLVDVRPSNGALVRLNRRGTPPLVRRARAEGSYLSSNDPRVHFGLGGAADYESITVTWPGGAVRNLPGGAANRIIRVRQGSAR